MNYEEMYASPEYSDMLICQGGEVKRMDGRRIGGYLVKFSTAADPDLEGDFFTKDTDFDILDGERRSLYYNHGFDAKIGNRKIGSFTTKVDDNGLWLDGAILENDEYADMVWELQGQRVLGYSSGAISHLVRREKVSKSTKVHQVTHWAIGEGSITNRACEPRTRVIPLKSWFGETTEPQIVENTAAPHKAAFSIATIREFEDSLRDAGLSRSQAVALASHGFKGLLRDAGEPENLSDTFRGDALRELARIELQHLRMAGVAL
jgi:phage head maturation protease